MFDELLVRISLADVLTLSLVKASIILAIAQFWELALRRLSAASKHLILTAGMAAFLVVPLLALAAPSWRVVVTTAPAVAPVAPPEDAAPQLARTAAEITHSETSRAIVPALNGARAAVILWAVVALAVASRLLRSAMRLRTIVADSTTPSARLLLLLAEVHNGSSTPPVRLLRSNRVDVPAVWGVRSGTLLLPDAAEEWSDEQLRSTFIHELGHLRRFDYVTLAMMNFLSTLLWFHPQIRLARRRALALCERACDDLVLRAGERPSEYASHLLCVARQASRNAALVQLFAMSRPSQLDGRMSAILSPATNRQTPGGKQLMISLVAFLALVFPVAGLQFAAQPVVAAAPSRPTTPSVVAAPVVATSPAPAVASLVPERVTSVVAARVESTTTEPVAAPEVEAETVVAHATEAAPATEVNARPVEDSLAEPVVAAAAGDAPAPTMPRAVSFIQASDLDARPFTRLGKVSAHACTLKLNRPVNTGDPARNPAEALATERLSKKAAEKGADAVTSLKCYRQILIGGFSCPTSVVCEGDAIKFDE